MQFPLNVSFRDIENTQAINSQIRKKAEKLQHLYERITYCRVAVEAAQKNKHRGKEYQVNIEVDVPGKVLVVNRQSHRNEDLYVAIRDSFNAIKRQLEDHARRQRGNIKSHQPHLTGKIVRLFSDYGFIETPDGEEYYFHEANVSHAFNELEIGSTVHFYENTAGDSLQAHSIAAA